MSGRTKLIQKNTGNKTCLMCGFNTNLMFVQVFDEPTGTFEICKECLNKSKKPQNYISVKLTDETGQYI